MNFTGRQESTLGQRELKYCERCGSLFLRRSSTDIAYCTICQAHWARLIEADDVILHKANKSRVIGRKMRLTTSKRRRDTRVKMLRGRSVSEVSAC
jgi:ribosomal protein L37AE/L43A